MAPKSNGLSSSFLFVVALSAITVIANLVTYSIGSGPNFSGMIPFLCFLPIAFLVAETPGRKTLEYVKALEARIERLELEKQGG